MIKNIIINSFFYKKILNKSNVSLIIVIVIKNPVFVKIIIELKEYYKIFFDIFLI